MSLYIILKVVHILSATVLFGTGLGIAYFKWSTDRSNDLRAICDACQRVVIADWLFTLPAAVIQPVSGIALALHVGYPLDATWLVWAFGLYAAAGACWLRVLWLQVRMRDLALAAVSDGRALGIDYAAHRVEWFWLGIIAFTMFIGIFWLMVARPV